MPFFAYRFVHFGNYMIGRAPHTLPQAIVPSKPQSEKDLLTVLLITSKRTPLTLSLARLASTVLPAVDSLMLGKRCWSPRFDECWVLFQPLYKSPVYGPLLFVSGQRIENFVLEKGLNCCVIWPW